MNGDQELEKRLSTIEHRLITIIHDIEKRNNDLYGELTINKPIIFSPLRVPSYSSKHIGYTISNSIDENMMIMSGNEFLVTSILLPCYGVWNIHYRMELNLTLGFTCLKNSKISINTNLENHCHTKIIDDINTVNIVSNMTTTVSNSLIYNVSENKLNLYLFVNFTFGRTNNLGTFNIIPRCIPILSGTRIA